MIQAAELRQRVKYSWVVRWRPDYRPDTPFPPLHHEFWSLNSMMSGIYVPIAYNKQQPFWHHVSYSPVFIIIIFTTTTTTATRTTTTTTTVTINIFTHIQQSWPIADFFDIIPGHLAQAHLHGAAR